MRLVKKPTLFVGVFVVVLSVAIGSTISFAEAATKNAQISKAKKSSSFMFKGKERVTKKINPDGTVRETYYLLPREESYVKANLTQAGGCKLGGALLSSCDKTSQYEYSELGSDQGFWAGTDVTFADSTGSMWPVKEAIGDWTKINGISPKWKSGSCSSSVRCINVKEVNVSDDCWIGQTTIYRWGELGRTTVPTHPSTEIMSAHVNLNVSRKLKCPDDSGNLVEMFRDVNSSGLRQAACHELGHALGLGHNLNQSSCMYRRLLNQASATKPASDDINLLTRLYTSQHPTIKSKW